MKKSILIVVMLGFRFLPSTAYSADKAPEWQLNHYLRSYTNQQGETDPKLAVSAMCSFYKRERESSDSPYTSSWVVLDIISKYQMPGCDVVPSLLERGNSCLHVSDKTLKWIVDYLVTEKTMPSILAKRQTASWWGSVTGWAADHIPAVAADAKQSQLEALRAEIVKEYKAYRAAAPQSNRYKKDDGDDELLPLLPTSGQ